MQKMEIFDLVDEKGNVISTASREECHSNPKLLHPVVHFTLYNSLKKEILLTQRSFKKRWDPGKHVFFGEHVLSGETFQECVIRGALEELQYKSSEIQMVGQHVFNMESQSELVRFFIVMYKGGELDFDREEIERIFWLRIDKLTAFSDNVSDMTKYWIDNIDWSTLSI
jgi:isopentenyldiphosphate isomerase